MPIAVYSAKKPASPVRAWASALVLFAGVSVLAWSMAKGQLDRQLAIRQVRDDLGISFRLPKGFGEAGVQPFSSGTLVTYRAGEGASRLVLSVFRFTDAAELTASRVCDLVIQAGTKSRLRALLIGGATQRVEQIGGRAGQEVESAALAMVVRAVVTDGHAIAFALNGRDPLAVRRAYASFDLACRSVEFAVD